MPQRRRLTAIACIGAILALGGCRIAGVVEPDGTTRLTDEQYLPPIGQLIEAAPGKVILSGNGTRPLPQPAPAGEPYIATPPPSLLR